MSSIFEASCNLMMKTLVLNLCHYSHNLTVGRSISVRFVVPVVYLVVDCPKTGLRNILATMSLSSNFFMFKFSLFTEYYLTGLSLTGLL